MLCPRCMFEQESAEICINCSVVIEKFLQAHDGEIGLSSSLHDNPSARANKTLETYETAVEPPAVSGGYKILLIAFLLGMSIYSLMVVVNNQLTRKSTKKAILTAFSDELKHELKIDVILGSLAQICDEKNVDVIYDDISVEFLPDANPIRGENIHYFILVSVPYNIPYAGYSVRSSLDFKVNDSLEETSMKGLRLKSIFGLG